jgi:hypothetical protein
MSSAAGGISSLMSAYDTLLTTGWRGINPRTVQQYMANGPAAAVGLMLHVNYVNRSIQLGRRPRPTVDPASWFALQRFLTHREELGWVRPA